MEFYQLDRQSPNPAESGAGALAHAEVARPRREVTARRRAIGQRGSTITEFAIVIPFISIALFGTVSFGISLGRYVQVMQVCRDLAHMHADGIDFTQSVMKDIAVKLATGTGMTAAGGNGVVILSRVRTVYAVECTPACPNTGFTVFAQRVTVGNTALRASSFGTPNPAILGAKGNINPSVYLQNTDATVRTSNLSALFTAAGRPVNQDLAQNDVGYICEVYFTAPDISFLDFSYSTNLRSTTSGGAYARFIF